MLAGGGGDWSLVLVVYEDILGSCVDIGIRAIVLGLIVVFSDLSMSNRTGVPLNLSNKIASRIVWLVLFPMPIRIRRSSTSKNFVVISAEGAGHRVYDIKTDNMDMSISPLAIDWYASHSAWHVYSICSSSPAASQHHHSGGNAVMVIRRRARRPSQ